MVERGRRLGHALGTLSLASAKRPKTTLTAIVLATLIVAGGMTQLETEADLLKLMPKDDPHTSAAVNASTTFRGFYDFVTLFYEIDAAKCERASSALLPERLTPQRCGNVTDEVYIRAMDELERFFRTEMPEAEYAIDLANIVKTVNWTNSGYFGDPRSSLQPLLSGNPENLGRPQDAAFSMPGRDAVGEAQFEAAWRAANEVDESVNDVIAPTFQAGRTLFFFNTSDGMSRVELGSRFYAAVDAYQAAIETCDSGAECSLTWNVWKVTPGEPSFAVRGVSTLDAHASEVTQRDIGKLAPIIVWAIVAILYLAFRDVRVILVAATNLFVAFLWTAGLMGWLKIPFSALNMTVVPLILGVGIDYGIHMVSEFLEHRSEGKQNTEAFRLAGRRAGIAMLIATVTTASGLLVMLFSPSVLMAQLAVVASMALAVTFLFTMTFIPAVLVLTARPTQERHRGSSAIVAVAEWLGKHRTVSVVTILLLSGLALVGIQNLEPEPFGNPELNYPHGDRVRDDATKISELFFGGSTDTQTNYLIVEGDFTQPEALAFLDSLESNLHDHPRLQGFNTATMNRVIRAWVTIDQGTPDAAAGQALKALGRGLEDGGVENEFEDAQFPKTQEEVKQTLDAIFASPFANFMTILLNPDPYNIGVVPFDTRQELSHADVQEIWLATEEVIAQTKAETGYNGVMVHQFGNNAMSYLFIEEQQPWVNKVGYIAFGLVIVLIGALTRSWRATLCTATIMALTSLWWLGLLPSLGVGLSVGLMLPLVFIMAIGSDDAIHLIWNMEQSNDRPRVYRFVGQAVFLTTITTVIAFGLFSLQTDLLVRRTILATAAAVLVMWVTTMLVVPVYYPPKAPLVQLKKRPIDATAPPLATVTTLK